MSCRNLIGYNLIWSCSESKSFLRFHYWPLIRRYNETAKDAESRLAYLLSLLEKPESAKLTSVLTPERWPDVTLQSELFPSRNTDRVLPDTNTGGTLPDTTNGGILPDTNTGGTLPDTTTTILSSIPETLNDFLATEIPIAQIADPVEEIRSLLKSLRIESTFSLDDGISGRNSMKPGRNEMIPMLKDVKFGDLRNKDLVSVLAKTFGFEYEPRGPKEETLLKPSLIMVPEFQAKVSNDHKGKRPLDILVITGADLHLLNHSYLQSLAKLYGVETSKDSQSALERGLCRYFISIDPDKVQRLAILERDHEDGKAFQRLRDLS